MTRVLVIGRNGQVATALSRAAESDGGLELTHLGRPQLDLSGTSGIADEVASRRPKIVINPAAYTAVDKAENEPEIAHAINAIAAGEVARGAAIAGAPIIHLSTDYVFDGRLNRPYEEDDAPAPLGVYGRTKLEGEKHVRAANPDHLIVRTAWIYSPYGSNFLKTMLRLGAERDELSIVDDQIGCPTSADDLALALLGIAKRGLDKTPRWTSRTIHLAGAGQTSWFGFAEHIFAVAAQAGRKTPVLKPVATAGFPTQAIRPANSRLDCQKARKLLGIQLPDWRSSVAGVTQELIGVRIPASEAQSV